MCACACERALKQVLLLAGRAGQLYYYFRITIFIKLIDYFLQLKVLIVVEYLFVIVYFRFFDFKKYSIILVLGYFEE